MNFKSLLFTLTFIVTITCNAQLARVDTIAFTLEKKLLLFKGSINGVPVDFAFDTGAGLGLANSAVEKKSHFIIKNSKKKILDANMQVTKIETINIQQLSIGSYNFNNIKSVLHDMEYLQCNELYLLGMDVIGKLNWQINFETNTLQVSETPFAVSENFMPLPIGYKNNRPTTDLVLNNTSIKKCLIDFGYNGVIEMPESDFTNTIFAKKQAQGLAAIGLSSNMAVTGLGKPDTVKYLAVDSVIIGNKLFKNVPITISKKTDFKIGVNFFANYCSTIVLNHKTNSYYFVPKNTPTNNLNKFTVGVIYSNGKLVIAAQDLSANTTIGNLQMGEEIKAINGKTIADFTDNCAFLNFYFFNNKPQMVIEKMNGEKVVVTRILVK